MSNYFIFPMKTLTISQGYYGGTSHRPHNTATPSDWPIDISGSGRGRDWVYCPCDEMVIKRIYGVGTKGTNTIWLQSTSKVDFADGTSNFAVMMMMHPNDDDLRKLKVGRKFKRKEPICREGTDGWATGNHIHFSVGKGTITGNGWTTNRNGKWVLTTSGGAKKPETLMYVDSGFTKIVSGCGYSWKTKPKDSESTKKSTPSPSENSKKEEREEASGKTKSVGAGYGSLMLIRQDESVKALTADGKINDGNFKIIIRRRGENHTSYDITGFVTAATWSGNADEASRHFDFDFVTGTEGESIGFSAGWGDIVFFFFAGKLKYLGMIETVTFSEGGIMASAQSSDFLNLIIKSKVSYLFKNKTASQISKKIIGDLGFVAGSHPGCKRKIKTFVVDEESAYKAIMSAFKKEHSKTGKRFFPYMDGKKVCVGVKGKKIVAFLSLDSEVTSLERKYDISETVTRIKVLDQNGNFKQYIRSAEASQYGIRQETYKLSEGETIVDAKNALLDRFKRETSVESVGKIEATAGHAIALTYKISGKTYNERFWIESDSHSFENGQHTMSLTLTSRYLMEGEESEEKERPFATVDAACWFSEKGKCFHSSKKCSGSTFTNKSTVEKAMDKGKKKCSRCWI